MLICPKCNARYQQDHECPEDGESMLDRIRDLEKKVEKMQEQIDGLTDK